jgi:hypothetical protein
MFGKVLFNYSLHFIPEIQKNEGQIWAWKKFTNISYDIAVYPPLIWCYIKVGERGRALYYITGFVTLVFLQNLSKMILH